MSSENGGYVLYVWTPTGYRLEDRDGAVPAVGEIVQLGDTAYEVQKIGISPLPGDARPCAFLVTEP